MPVTCVIRYYFAYPFTSNCLFRALADQLDDTRVTHRSLRTDIAEFMRTNVQDFKPFMEEEGISYEEYSMCTITFVTV